MALTSLVRASASIVWRVCAALVDTDSADDLTQDTFLRAIRALPGYRGDASPVRWLVTIARRVCAEEISRRSRDRSLAVRLRQLPIHPPEEPFTTVALADALSRLARPRLEAFLLTVVAGLSYAEVARACGCPVGTIRSRVSRARADLQQSMSNDRSAGDPPTNGRMTS